MIRTLIVILLLAWSQAVSARSGPAISYRSAAEKNWAEIARGHGISPEELRQENPGQESPGNDWLLLPEDARLPRESVIALMASAKLEISEILKDMTIDGSYRIVGREFVLGSWRGRRIIAGVAGGNMTNAAIGATILNQRFNVSAMGFVGIAGGGGDMRVGDVLIASGALQNDQGTWYDFEAADGGTVAGLAWYMAGQPVLTDAGHDAQLVLFPRPALLACIRESTASIELPLIGAEVAAFHDAAPYRPSIWSDGWSASGSQFMMSFQARETLERRAARAAARLQVPPPPRLIIDQEDFAAVLAAEEHGVPWFVVRTVVDMAAQGRPEKGVPMALYDDPGAIPQWLQEHNALSYGEDFDWSYFYRQIAIVSGAIVEHLAPQTGCLPNH